MALVVELLEGVVDGVDGVEGEQVVLDVLDVPMTEVAVDFSGSVVVVGEDPVVVVQIDEVVLVLVLVLVLELDDVLDQSIVVVAGSPGKVLGAAGPGPVLTVDDARAVVVVDASSVAVVELVVSGAIVMTAVVSGGEDDEGWETSPVAATMVVSEVPGGGSVEEAEVNSDCSAGTTTMSPERTRIA